jgi:CRP/FNR family transcriptional regulator
MFAQRRVETVGPNTAIVTAGDPATHVIQLISGCVRVCRVAVDGRRSILRFRFGIDYFGELFEGRYGNTAEAVTAVQLRRVPAAELRGAAERNSSLHHALRKWSAHSLWVIQNHFVVLSANTTREKLARFLLLLAQEEHCKKAANTIILPMGRLDIADYLGVTIESVSRSFSSFARGGYIALRGYHEVHVKEPHKLMQIAGVENFTAPQQARFRYE